VVGRVAGLHGAVMRARIAAGASWRERERDGFCEAGRADVTRQEHITINIASLDSANVASGFSQALADRMAAGL
jgi:hypothetical protein